LNTIRPRIYDFCIVYAMQDLSVINMGQLSIGHIELNLDDIQL